MDVKFVDLSRQYKTIKAEVDRSIAAVIERADFVLGREVALFEAEFAAYCEAAHCVGLDNGTSALELALRALGIGAGDEVLVPANSFMASASAVSFTGATPVLVDVDPYTYNLDPTQLERHITPRTRAIMPVHLYGQPADMDPILATARRHGLFVVEDACQAHGARYKGRRVGSLGDIAAFSFYPGKNLGAYGDAGAIVTNNSALADAVRIMRNCGQSQKYHHVALATNRRLDTVQAAVLRVKLRYLDAWNAQRRAWASLYHDRLATTPVCRPIPMAEVEPVYHLYVIQALDRDALKTYLAHKGIAAGIHYPTPIHLQPACRELGYNQGDFPISEACAPYLLSLPMFPEMTADEVRYVVDHVNTFTQQMDQPSQLDMLPVWAVA